MTCTILLVTLMMVCTVSFICGTQSGSVLKEVLSATGNNPRLHKTRDVNDKYGPFRKTLVPESMRHAKKRDNPISPRQPLQPCTYSKHACALVEKHGDRQPTSTSLCNCSSITNTDCNENWEDSSTASVTLRNPIDSNVQMQFKFCKEVQVNNSCNTEKTAAVLVKFILTKGVDKWVYWPACKCHNNIFEVGKIERKKEYEWKWTLVCDKPSCSPGSNCVQRFDELRNNVVFTTYTYLCVCSGNCPPLEADQDIASDFEGGQYSSFRVGNCSL